MSGFNHMDVKRPICFNDSRGIAISSGLQMLFKSPIHGLQVILGCILGSQLGGFRFQHHTKLQQLTGAVLTTLDQKFQRTGKGVLDIMGHDRPHSMSDLYQAFRFYRSDGIAHDAAADAPLLHHLALGGQRSAGGDIATEDHLFQPPRQLFTQTDSLQWALRFIHRRTPKSPEADM